MLFANTGRVARRIVVAGEHWAGAHLAGLGDAVWLDLLLPDDEERSLVERATGLRVPSLADLSEVESSSRLSRERGALYLSTPMTFRDAEGVSRTAPLGFVVSERALLTVRFVVLPVFDMFAERFAGSGAGACGALAFLGLLEAIVDRLADVLEHVGGDLDGLARRVFRAEPRVRRADVRLQATLREVGRAGERLSNIRDSLVGVQRILGFAADAACAWVPAAEHPRFGVLRQDIVSLADYDTQLQNKVQFLLDATLGFISIEQNNGIKVLTVVSVVGVPPTLVASIYGMNFKLIPELQWQYGYYYGLGVILLSGLVPLVWFKRRGWI